MTDTPPAVVVVTHQTRDEVLGCLASIDVETDVVVVDNGSTDGTAGAVRQRHPHVEVLELANAGFARGANAGVRATRAEVVVVANADVRFGAGALARLARVFDDDPALGAAGPLVRYPSGAIQASARRVPGAGDAFGHAVFGRLAPGNRWTRRYHDLPADALPRERDVDWLSGCAIAVRRQAFDAVGGFDPGYFLYVEDVDLGVRLRDAGWRLRHVPEAEVTHVVGASTRHRPLRARIAHARGIDRFHARHHRTAAGVMARPIVRAGLVLWVFVGWLADRFASQRRSSTGERRTDHEGVAS